MKRRIAIKIGSNVLTRNDGKLDITRMSSLVDQIADLHRQGIEILLISSGAVASGKVKSTLGNNWMPFHPGNSIRPSDKPSLSTDIMTCFASKESAADKY